jgi:hypothetical protein
MPKHSFAVTATFVIAGAGLAVPCSHLPCSAGTRLHAKVPSVCAAAQSGSVASSAAETDQTADWLTALTDFATCGVNAGTVKRDRSTSFPEDFPRRHTACPVPLQVKTHGESASAGTTSNRVGARSLPSGPPPARLLRHRWQRGKRKSTNSARHAQPNRPIRQLNG